MADDAQIEAAARAARSEFSRGYLPDLWTRVARAALTAAAEVGADATARALAAWPVHHEETIASYRREYGAMVGRAEAAERELRSLRTVVARVVRQGGGVAQLREYLATMPTEAGVLRG